MKKLLALVLALVMSMSLVTISNAAFSDAADIDYKEAVDVLAAVGVLEGSDGKFDPKAELTREQAAKIIAYLDLGKSTAEALPAVKVFNDVEASRWSAKFIAYCADAGYINGVGNGNFDPTGKLTGYAFGKLLLCALGYDATIEEMTGANWTIKVAKLMEKNSISKGTSKLGSAVLTREEAAQYALNALKATMVEYDEKGSTITAGDVTIVTGAKKAKDVEISDEKYTKISGETFVTGNKYTVQLGEKLYDGKLVLSSGSSDDFGAPATTWTYKNEKVGDYAKSAVATFTAKTKAADVAKALGNYKFTDGAASNPTTKKVENTTDTTINAKVNVNAITASGKTTATSMNLNTASATLAEQFATRTENGRLVAVYANDDSVITDIVIVEYKTVEAGKVSTDKKTGDISYVIDGTTYKDFADKDTADTISFITAPAKGDIVTYCKIGSKVYVYPTTSFEGTQTATKTSDSVQTITVSGSDYKVGKYAKSGTTFANNTKGETATYYVDQYGFVVHTDSKTTASTDYAYVIDTEAKVEKSLSDTTVTLKAKVILADGTVAVYPVALDKDDDSGDYTVASYKKTDGSAVTIYDKSANTVTSGAQSAADELKTKVVGYTISDGKITFENLKALPDGAAAESTVYGVTAAQVAKINKSTSYSVTMTANKTVLVDAKTVYVAYNTTSGKTTVYTGLDALPKSIAALNGDTGATALGLVMKTGTTANTGVASVVFFEVSSNLTADATDKYVYVTNDLQQVVIDGKNKNQYTAYAADGTTSKVIASGTSITAGLYVPNKDGEISGSPKTNSDNNLIINGAKLTVDNVDNKMVKSGNNWYYLTDNTKVVYVDDDLSEIDGNQGVIILVKDTSNVDVIYVYAD